MASENEAQVKLTADSSQAEKSLASLGAASKKSQSQVESLGQSLNKLSVNPSGLKGISNFDGSSPVIQQSSLMTQRVNEATQSFNQQAQHTSVLRNAMQDLALTYTAVGTGAAGLVWSIQSVGASFETAFTGVERTADLPAAALASLRQDLVDLSTAIPESFENLSGVATLGGQLGIAGNALDDFTQQVTMFSATTDATLDKTATGFGRLAQLTDATSGDFDKISSSIYKVGVETVATESQIITIAQEIATAGDMAGFSASEIIGLSGAFASLAIQPERARGNVLRIFGQIDKAIAQSGDQLQIWADLAGMSAQEFTDAWANQSGETFQSILRGMEGVIDSGGNLRSVLSDLGVNGVRDAQTMMQLANNMDLVTLSMNEAAQGWISGTETADAYGLVADNVAAKLEMLKNTISAILDAMSNSAVVGSLISLLQALAGTIKSVVETPIGPWLGSFVTIGGGAVAVFSLLSAGALLLKGGYLALITTQQKLQANGTVLDLTFKNITKTLLGYVFGADSATASTGRLGTMMQATTARIKQSEGAMKALSLASTGLKVLGGAGLALGIADMVTSLVTGEGIISRIGAMFEDASGKAERLGISFAGLSEALQADTKAASEGAEVYRYISVNVDEAAESSTVWSQVLQDVAAAQGVNVNAADMATGAIRNQTVAIGENTLSWVANQLASNEALQKVYREMGPTLDQLGFSFQEYANAVVNNSVPEYLERMRTAMDAARQSAVEASHSQNWAAYSEATTLLDDLTKAYNDLNDIGIATGEGMEEQASNANFLTDIQQALGIAVDDTTDGLEAQAGAVKNLADELFGGLLSTADFEQAMYNLGASVAENGDSFDAFSEGGRANLQALQAAVNAASKAAGDDAALLAQYLNQIIGSVGSAGPLLANAFGSSVSGAMSRTVEIVEGSTRGIKGWLGNIMAVVPEIKSAAVPQINNLSSALESQSFAAGMADKQNENYAKAARSAGKGAQDAAEKIYTLKDYMSDLSGVMKRSFELRWSLDQSVDKVADQYQKMADNLEEARQRVIDLRTDLRGLQADLNVMSADEATLQYQLGVAQDYGDTLREKSILAELAKLREDMSKKSQDMAKKNADLGKAQSALNRDLSGTTAESRAQRSEVLALVQAYQDQILALSDSGRSQQEVAAETERLRQKFIAQMQQLGYNRVEAERYSQSFRDMKKVIESIPKNITITANTNPAQQAINEFRARNTGGRGASAPINVPIGTTFNDAGAKKAARAGELMAQMARLQADMANPNVSAYSKHYTLQGIRDIARRLNSGNYWSGGFTGRGGKYEPAGTVHRGEYVVPKSEVNQATGKPYWMERGFYTGGYVGRPITVNAPQVSVVELGPQSIRAIEKSGGAVVMLDGKVIAQSTNAINTNNSVRGN